MLLNSLYRIRNQNNLIQLQRVRWCQQLFICLWFHHCLHKTFSIIRTMDSIHSGLHLSFSYTLLTILTCLWTGRTILSIFFHSGKGLSFVAYGRNIMGQNTKHSRLKAAALTLWSALKPGLYSQKMYKQRGISDCLELILMKKEITVLPKRPHRRGIMMEVSQQSILKIPVYFH